MDDLEGPLRALYKTVAESFTSLRDKGVPEPEAWMRATEVGLQRVKAVFEKAPEAPPIKAAEELYALAQHGNIKELEHHPELNAALEALQAANKPHREPLGEVSGPAPAKDDIRRESREAGSDSGAARQRMSLRLSPEARAAVDKIMRLGHMATMQEAIRRAIGDELFLLTQRRDGWKVVLQKGNRYREVNWPEF